MPEDKVPSTPQDPDEIGVPYNPNPEGPGLSGAEGPGLSKAEGLNAGQPAAGGEPASQAGPLPREGDGALKPDELAQVKAQLQEEQKVRLEAQAAVATATETVQAANTRIAALEAALIAKDQEIATRQEKVATLEKSLADTQAGLAKAAGKYRDMLLAKQPAVPQELVTGATIEEVDASLAKAHALVEKVKAHISAQATVPAGAPIRTSVPLEGLSPGEKIRLAVRGK